MSIAKYFHVGATDVVIVLVDEPNSFQTSRRLRRAIAGLIAKGLRSIVASDARVDALWNVLASQPVAVATEWQPTALPQITTAALAVDSSLPYENVLTFGPPRLVFVDAEARDPESPGQPLAARSDIVRLEHLLEEL